MHWIGVDLGRVVDYATINVIEDRLIQKATSRHDVVGLTKVDRIAIEDVPTLLVRKYETRVLEEMGEVSYPMIASRVATIANNPLIHRDYTLVIDATGVGVAVMDILRDAPYHLNPIGVTITAGHTWGASELGYNVSKIFLVENMQALFQTGRLQVANALKLAQKYRDQLRTFTAKVTPKGNETFGHDKESDKDDLVMGAAIVLWYAEKVMQHEIVLPGQQAEEAYDPARAGLS